MQWAPAHTVPQSPARPDTPGSTSTVDYSTQDDPDQPAQELHKFLTPEQQWIKNNHNYLLPDGTRRTIFDIPSHELHFFPLFARNGNNAYLIELPNLQEMLIPRGSIHWSILCCIFKWL